MREVGATMIERMTKFIARPMMKMMKRAGTQQMKGGVVRITTNDAPEMRLMMTGGGRATT